MGNVPNSAAGDSLLETLSASPSTAEATSTSDPHPTTDNTYRRAPSAAQFRDPERYQVIGEHGRGGLGRVSRAYDRDLGRDVAIKELISRGNLSEVRFLREALITARLEHPGIVPVHEAGRWPDGTPFYAMKLVAGRPLRDLIAERLTVAERIGLLHHVIAIADAIAYAHGRNVIHRDLKPANVIVGDFGETIVIDWGLAKNLSASEQSTIVSGPFRGNQNNDLTEAGSVLGTPSYMAPEQERGDHVDQRADVFAIGAMLWELCSLQKVPPTDPRLRKRLLTRSRIDQDLITILDKALDPDPKRRYPDAGALAADLKAFKSGSRIAARNYSLLAVATHWTRRHRSLAFGGMVLAAIAIVSSAVYVHNIESERARVEAAQNGLILEHADLLLQTDPTAAFDLLHSYHGIKTPRLAMLTAKASGLGLARIHTRPHTSAILHIHPLKTGSLLTLSLDGTVAKIAPMGFKTTIAHDATTQGVFDFSSSRELLAYACDSAVICLLDTNTERMLDLHTRALQISPIALSFSPDGSLLAALSSRGSVSLWQLSQSNATMLGEPVVVKSGVSLKFADDKTLAVLTQTKFFLYRFDATYAMKLLAPAIEISNGSYMATDSRLQVIAVGTSRGELIIINGRLGMIEQRSTPCKSNINNIAILTRASAIGYACHDGDTGTWNLDNSPPTVLAHIEGGIAIISVSPDARYMVMGGNNGKLFTLDLWSKLITTSLGHATQITALTPPSSEYPYTASGDTTGALKIWAPPDRDVRVVARTPERLHRATFLFPNGPLLAIGEGGTIPWFQPDGRSGELRGHFSGNYVIATSATLPHFVMYGIDDTIELWSLDTSPEVHRLKTNHGSVNAVVYTSATRFVVGSHDGTLAEWTDTGVNKTVLGKLNESIVFLRALPNSDSVIIGGVTGNLWLSNSSGIGFWGKEEGAIVSAVVSHDANWLAVGTSRGLVKLYNIRTKKAIPIINTTSHVEHLAFSFDNSQLAVASEDRISLVAINGEFGLRTKFRPSSWSEVELSVRYLAYSADNNWLAATCDNGAIWLYNRGNDTWRYISIGSAKVSSGGFSADSKYFAASDVSGKAVIITVH